jgi:N-acetylmuramoyl-L-alanine amidase
LRLLNKAARLRSAVFTLAIVALSPSIAVSTPPDNLKSQLLKAKAQYQHAQEMETLLNDKPEVQRTRTAYLNVIKAFQRVYLITPKTGYADNALMSMARLYDEIKDNADELRTLNFLVKEYPKTPFRNAAERDIARLQGVPEKKLSNSSVENIRYWEAPNSVRVVVDLTAEADFKQGEAKSPDRVFIDIAQSRLNAALVGKPLSVGLGLLQQIRVGQYDASTVRVVLDVGDSGKVTSFALHDPERLIIDVVSADSRNSIAPGTATAVPVSAPPAPLTTTPVAETTKSSPPLLATASNLDAAPAPAAKSAPVAEKKPPVASTTPKSAAKINVATKVDAKPAEDDVTIIPAKPTGNGDRSLVRSLGLKLQRVIIDPGHGGHDTGTIGPSGYTEKDLVLDVSKRLKGLIEKEIGAEVILTRDDDRFIPLESRTAIANQHEGDLFISVHANSSRVRTVRGVETFFLNLTTSREALDIATRENAASEHSIHELQDLSKKILLQDKVEESRELARVMQKSLAGRKNSGVDRGVKQAPFIVLMGANMPSILTEISFISNPQEEKLLKDSDYRQSIAESLFAGVKSYSESLSGLKTAKIQEKN